MKLTVDKARLNGMMGRVEVRLNGLTLTKGCIMADEGCGAVEINRLDLFKKGMDYLPTERLNGKVQILLGDRF